MKFTIALASAIASAQASNLQAEASQLGGPYQGDAYYNYPAHHPADYSHNYDEVLPGADFNRQVWEFDNHGSIWDQNDYTERVKMEAQMLVALESLKESVMTLNFDITNLNGHIETNYHRINDNESDIYSNMAAVQ